MRHLLRLAIVVAALLATVACKERIITSEPQLEVTANNISGVWRLASWNGAPLGEGTYVYIEFTRRDQLFTIYQNTDSFIARKITGRYNIDLDEELGAVIRGQYDYGNGDWRHRYIITNLSHQEMTWTAQDDAEDVSVYERCDAVPSEIIAQTE